MCIVLICTFDIDIVPGWVSVMGGVMGVCTGQVAAVRLGRGYRVGRGRDEGVVPA